MDELIIRKMQHSDVPRVLEIERLLFSTPWSEDSFLNEIYKKYAISKVAVIDGNIIGYICANFILHEAHILNLAVLPDFQRRGVATVLMNESLKELKEKGCVFMYLEVRASNAGARQFYELFGFKVMDVRKKYYINPNEDALLMMGRV
jgi:ribosomal-protein-alanine N-acetyltransferase